MNRNIVFIMFLVLLPGKRVFADSEGTSQEYYCPRGELLVGKQCYKDMKSAVMKKKAAEEHCRSLGKKLPESSLDQTALSGWVQETTETWKDIKESFCVYSYPNPLGVASPDNPLFDIAPCSRKLRVLCSKELPTNTKCEVGWREAVRNTYKYCVRPSDTRTAAPTTGFGGDICPGKSKVFSFNYRNNEESLTYTKVEDNQLDLFQPFWTPYYLADGQTIDSSTGSTVRSLACLYKTGSLHVRPVSCDSVRKFHCQSPAGEVPHHHEEDAHPYNPDNDYSCGEEGDVLCKNKCYKHWRSYKTQSKAEKNCTAGGYKLTTEAVPCIEYTTGWVPGSFEDGKLTTTCKLPLIVEHCVHLYKGETRLADCRMRANALYTVQLEEGETSCPDSFHKCGTKQVCVGSSTEELTWSDAVNNVPRDRRRLLGVRSMLDDCSATIKQSLTQPLWIGARRSKGGIVEFNNGEKITVKSEKQCLKMVGGKLTTADCNTEMYFTCEKLAVVSATSSALVIGLVVGPLLLLGLVLLLLYKRKGKEMCMSRSSAAGVEEADAGNGVTLSNPLAEEAEERQEMESGTTEKQKRDHLYQEVDI